MAQDHEFGRSAASPSLASPSLDAGSATPSEDGNSMLLDALAPFAARADYIQRNLPDDWNYELGRKHKTADFGWVTVGDLRRAKAAYDLYATGFAVEGVADPVASDGEVSKAAQPLQTTEPKGEV